METKKYAVVDLETTGHSPVNGDRIIQIAIVFIQNGEIGDKYVRFVNPQQKIPTFIRQLTNIDDEDVEHAQSFEEIAKEVRTLLEDTIFVAHNTDFDLSFLQNEFKRCGLEPWTGMKIDTVELSKIIYPAIPSYRLQDISLELGIPLPSAHRADDDAEATSELLLACIEKLYALPEETLQLLHRKSFSLKSDLSFLFYEALKKSRTKETSRLFSTFRGIPYKVIKNINQSDNEALIYPLEDDLKTTALQSAYPQFESRESQFRFMDTVWETLSDEAEVAAEVPTGIGKTIAYLLPAAIRSIEKGKPVLISTYTNYLADKIKNSELVKLQEILNVELTATVIKGREHYISLGKFEELLLIAEQTYDEQFTMMQILVWLTETTTGDLSELNVSGGGQLFLNRIRKQYNKMAPDEELADYHNRLILQCEQSHFIITNHTMLLTDANRSQPLFKSLAGLIVDEAHQFAQAAIHLDEIVFSYTNWKYTMGQVGSEAEGQLLDQLLKLNNRFELTSSHVKEKLTHAFNRLATSFDEALGALGHYEPPTRNKRQGNRQVYPLNVLKKTEGRYQKVMSALTAYIDEAKLMESRLRMHEKNMTRNELALVGEWTYWIRELTIKAGEWVELFFDENTDDYTVWIEKDRRSIPGSLTITKSPLDGTAVTKKLQAQLQEEATGIVWTSGTLSIKDDARYIPNKLGLQPDVPLLIFDAPEHFYEGAEIYIVDNMPDIQQVKQSDFIESVVDAVIQTVMATGGRVFVLFTSHDMLRKTYGLITESGQLEEYALFAQGITAGSRMKLLKSFSQFNNSVLFGTSSFWEGIDVPGDALSAVIVVRLPFMSPEDPLYKAKAEQLTEKGLNPFTHYALPEAVIRLRQGFGRLIRSSSDKGFFIILDRRIETKSYGNKFLESLPAVPIEKTSLEVMVKRLENCYNR